MRSQQMNRVQRRLWQVFVLAGGESTDQRAVERFQRLLEDHVKGMPPGISRAMAWVLACEGEVDYQRLAADLEKDEGTRMSAGTARQRVSRAVRRLEGAIRVTPWIRRGRAARTAIVFQPTKSAASPRSLVFGRDPDDVKPGARRSARQPPIRRDDDRGR